MLPPLKPFFPHSNNQFLLPYYLQMQGPGPFPKNSQRQQQCVDYLVRTICCTLSEFLLDIARSISVGYAISLKKTKQNERYVHT